MFYMIEKMFIFSLLSLAFPWPIVYECFKICGSQFVAVEVFVYIMGAEQ